MARKVEAAEVDPNGDQKPLVVNLKRDAHLDGSEKRGPAMRIILTCILTLLAQSAAAHPGHLVEAAGHNHWVAGAAIGIAIAVGLWGAMKGNKETDEEIEEELEEEAA